MISNDLRRFFYLRFLIDPALSVPSLPASNSLIASRKKYATKNIRAIFLIEKEAPAAGGRLWAVPAADELR